MAGKRQFDDDTVIGVALDVFVKTGLHDATMNDLATATGVQRGSLYNAYGDKESLFLRAFDRYSAQFLQTARTALEHGNAAAKLEALFDAIIVNMTSGSPQGGCLTTRTALDATTSSAAVNQRVRKLLTELERLVAKAMRSPPESIPEVHANRLARVVVAMTRGLAVLERAGYSRRQLKETASTFIEVLSAYQERGA